MNQLLLGDTIHFTTDRDYFTILGQYLLNDLCFIYQAHTKRQAESLAAKLFGEEEELFESGRPAVMAGLDRRGRTVDIGHVGVVVESHVLLGGTKAIFAKAAVFLLAGGTTRFWASGHECSPTYFACPSKSILDTTPFLSIA